MQKAIHCKYVTSLKRVIAEATQAKIAIIKSNNLYDSTCQGTERKSTTSKVYFFNYLQYFKSVHCKENHL